MKVAHVLISTSKMALTISNKIKMALLKAYFTPQPAEFARYIFLHFDFGTSENVALTCPWVDGFNNVSMKSSVFEQRHARTATSLQGLAAGGQAISTIVVRTVVRMNPELECDAN